MMLSIIQRILNIINISVLEYGLRIHRYDFLNNTITIRQATTSKNVPDANNNSIFIASVDGKPVLSTQKD
jgi:hypothetical protein